MDKEFQKYFDEPILNIKKIEHKGNNQLFEIMLNNRQKFLLKVYSKMHMDNWKRGETEFKALSYLWKKGFKEIPQPIKFDDEENIAIYSFEDGRILKLEEIKKEHVEKAVDFLVKLHNLGNKDKQFFQPASSACLCLKDYVEVIDRRLSKITNFKSEKDVGKKAREFLDNEVIPKIKKLKEEFSDKAKKEKLDLKKELSMDEQVLTPADFGFHNILFKNGNCKFLDFEYFGRDDPTRQILDFLHHAQSDKIDENLKNYFVELYIKKRELSYDFRKRLNLLTPLIAITWVLICLNVLSEKQLEHLKFAHGSISGLIEERLESAKENIKKIG